MTYAWLIDTTMCETCYTCVVACKDEYIGNDWSPYSVPQTNTGQFWLNIKVIERGQLPGKIKVSGMPFLCNHCTNAPCQAAATGGAVYTRADGLVIIDPVKSVGQTQIVSACPYGVIYWNSELGIPQKCTGCAHLLDNGWTEPRCATTCSVGAIAFGELSTLQPLITAKGAQPLHPEWGYGPQVYYVGNGALGLCFVAGEVYDFTTSNCVEGATVTLTNTTTGASYNTTTDIFGDFWLDGLPANQTFSLKIAASGYTTSTLQASTSSGSVDMGDIPLIET